MSTEKVITCGARAIVILIPHLATDTSLTVHEEVIIALDEERADLRRQLVETRKREASMGRDKNEVVEMLAQEKVRKAHYRRLWGMAR